MKWKSLGDKTKKSRIKLGKENLKSFGEKINKSRIKSRKEMEKREKRK